MAPPGGRTDDILFSLSSWPRAILHVDGDAFFTSCEEAIHPELRGKPLITGGERGIVACASYAAKRIGIKRGVSLPEAKRICPGLIVLPSDYETYSLFSRRMFNIIRRYTPDVEEYSIDEAFADLTGMRRALRASYETIAERIRREIIKELGITVSAGLSLTKVLAKAASKHRKPDGFTVIPGRAIASYLRDLPVGKLWGIGPATTNYLNKMGVRTALEFARLPEETVKRRLTKPGVEIWREIRGESVYPVTAEEKSTYFSISKTKTFAPASADPDYLFAQLLRNVASACIKARRYDLAPEPCPLPQAAELLPRRRGGAPHPPVLLSPGAVGSPPGRLRRPAGAPRPLPGHGRHPPGSHAGRPSPVLPFRGRPPGGAGRAALRGGRRNGSEIRQARPPPGGSHLIEEQGKGQRGTPTVRERTVLYGETRRRHLPLPIFHGEMDGPPGAGEE